MIDLEPNIMFIMELADDFPPGRLPMLDFSLWLVTTEVEEGRIRDVSCMDFS